MNIKERLEIDLTGWSELSKEMVMNSAMVKSAISEEENKSEKSD